MSDFNTLISNQRQFFATGATQSYAFRLTQLKKLKTLLKTHEADIADALKQDLNKSTMEAVVTEILLVTEEIDFAIKNLHKWMRPTKVATPFPLLWPGRSAIYSEPYGTVLIIGPWNYPFQLIMSPLLGAMSAGNCVIVKPSEVAPQTQNVILRLIHRYFSPDYIAAIQADATQTEQLLKEKFDYIFFTGGTQIGKIVMQAAAEHLTPCTLELGGKSPCIVDESADLAFATRRIVWGKTTNAGQTCIAPDYLFIHESLKDKFVEEFKKVTQQFYGTDPALSSSYGRIVNQKHFERLMRLMTGKTILCGGENDANTRYIAPTLITDVSWQDPIMQEEIFGPLLPIITFQDLDHVIKTIQSQPKPLALYYFTKNKDHEKQVLANISFGGGCINDCLLQVANYHLPFGGVGPSGMGGYHGKYSFETFSHRKSIYKKTLPLDVNLEYPPYSDKKLWWLKKLLGIIY